MTPIQLEPAYNAPLSPPPSSPPIQSSPRITSKKLKKPPPITPKRFTRFFTPRTLSTRALNAGGSFSRTSRQLRDITHNAVNRRKEQLHVTPKKKVMFEGDAAQDEDKFATPRSSNRKRKMPFTPPESSPIQPTPSKKQRFSLSQPNFTIAEDPEPNVDPVLVPEPELEESAYPSRPVRIRTNAHAGLLQRSFGGLSIGRGRPREHHVDWQAQTGSFQSRPADVYASHLGVPFCSTACNTNTLVAVGDEEGNVTLLETNEYSNPFQEETTISFRPHTNAIMDIAFSSDDLLLATASGDQTAAVIDMPTQKVRFTFLKHLASVKQIRFQPGNDKVLATSSRDGTIQLWDLRCSGSNGTTKAVLDGPITFSDSSNTISGAHAIAQNALLPSPQLGARDVAGKKEVPSRRGEVSITSLSFLPNGRENLLMTACDASSSVKLWDVRSRYSRRGPATAISVAQQPDSHSKYRHFGINSLCLSGDGSRFYALSKDNTVYAYSTNHLIMGHAPEFSTTSRPRHSATEKEGLGPLYGLRHPKFHATTFYVKASLREARGDKPEMLAVGSSDGTPVLFPTDESLLKYATSDFPSSSSSSTTPLFSPLTSENTAAHDRPSLRRSSSGFGLSARLKDTIPIYEQGTALVRGHSREVTSVVWNCEGSLLSLSDDYTVRCWREDEARARDLRTGGEGQGRRWGCGWADMDAAFDEEEE